MPRASNSAKRQQAASNHRDTRHENGIVNPAKRVGKQKSQCQLDGSPKLAVENAATPPSVPTASLPSSNGSAKHHDDMAPDRKTTAGSRHNSLGAAHADSSTDSLSAPYGQSIPEVKHRQINVNDAKNNNVHRDPGPLDFAVTVLRSCPLHDTIAILIILMQVSPVALATIYMLFTLLTFVPPVTTSSGISITEIFDGIQGTPSLWTLVGMDVIMLLIWLFLFAPAQQFLLDLAQVVIALTLGGGGSSRTGAANNIFICVAIVGISQWTRNSKLASLSRLTSLFGPNRFITPDPDDPLEATVRAFEKRGTYGWVRSILAIHILTQGLVRWIREWYLRREKRDLQSQAQQDPEAGKSATFAHDATPDGGQPTTPADPNVSHGGSSTVSTKKRRKQSAQVRIRQPLWAALASTKIVMVKEYELSHAASESAGSNATDIHNLGNAPFNTQPEQVWICYVGCDEVCFNTSHFPDEESEPYEGAPAGIDASKPFYVRVNNAVWQPTRITPIEDNAEDSRLGTCWTGDIYGLTPLSTYDCEFVSTQTGEVIFATSVRTIQAKTRDLDAPSRASNSQRSRSRHDSPASTLRASIAAAESKLADEKARLKAARKDNKAKVNAAKKDIDKLTSAVQSAGGNDEKLRQKVAQNSIQQKQAEQTIAGLTEDLKELETVPEELLEQYRGKQGAWTTEKAQFDGARASFKSFKTSIHQELKSFEEEQSSLQAKRNKIASRIAKVDNEHARITDANARGLDEAERRLQARAALEADMARNEQQLADRINTLRAMNASKHTQVHEMAGYLSAYLDSFHHDGDPMEQTSPANQYASWAASASQFNPQALWPPVSMAAPPPSLGPAVASPFMHTMQPAIGTPPQHKTRGRSSSMLSDVSGFTQSTDDDERANNVGVIAPPGLGQAQASLRGTPTSTFNVGAGFHFTSALQRGDMGSGSGSGSGTGSGSLVGSGRSSLRSGSGSGGSVRDPTSPI